MRAAPRGARANCRPVSLVHSTGLANLDRTQSRMSSTGIRTACSNLRQSAFDTVLFPAPGAPLMSQIVGGVMTRRRIITRSGRATKTAARLGRRGPERRAGCAPSLRIGLNPADVEAVGHNEFVGRALMAVEHSKCVDSARGAI